MQLVLDALSLLVTAAGVLALLLSGLHPATFKSALPFAIELWTAAGLLRLAGSPSWTRVATVAVIIAVRQLVVLRLR